MSPLAHQRLADQKEGHHVPPSKDRVRRAVFPAAAVLLAAGCGSSSSGGAAGGGHRPGHPEDHHRGHRRPDRGRGLPNKSVVAGVKAGTYYAARNGYTVRYVVGDTATNPATALALAQKFVTQDHVFAVIGNSALLFTAASYLTAHNVPVIGASADGPEWITSKNMFSIWGPLQTTKVATTQGKFLKLMGVTNLADVAYSLPIASEAGESTAVSAQVAGVKVGYLNSKATARTSSPAPTTASGSRSCRAAPSRPSRTPPRSAVTSCPGARSRRPPEPGGVPDFGPIGALSGCPDQRVRPPPNRGQPRPSTRAPAHSTPPPWCSDRRFHPVVVVKTAWSRPPQG
jgi:hypothetical protein